METIPQNVASTYRMWFGLGYGHYQQYFSNIMAVSYIGGVNRSTWRKPLTT
jgi:hypothetical protein